MTRQRAAGRVYLDWNASAPLRPEARAAMLAAMDVVGNPASVHAEGRAAWAIVERARRQVARLLGADPDEIVFTGGATEANAIPLFGATVAISSATGHDSLLDTAGAGLTGTGLWPVDRDGRHGDDPVVAAAWGRAGRPSLTDSAEWIVRLCAANGETGALNLPGMLAPMLMGRLVHVDVAQAAGRVDLALGGAREGPLRLSLALSGHKLGGPAGVGGFFSTDLAAHVSVTRDGRSQERGVRPGTQNVVGIAGFGAAAEAARRDLEAGVWDGVAGLRNILEDRLVATAPDAIIIGAGAGRLPNTTCVAVPGWRGETQVMQLDLAGFAVSAGAACSSGKVGPSRALRAMGLDDVTASSAIRVSLGPTTTEDEIMRFVDAWTALYARRRAVAA